MPTTTTTRSSSPMRGGGGVGGASVGEYSSTSSLLQEITSLRSRLRDLEDDSKSSVVSSSVIDDKDSPLATMLKKDIAQLEQEKALQEKDFLNQMSSLQVDHQKQVSDLQEKVKKKDELNNIINDKLRKYVSEKDELSGKLATSCAENKSLVEKLKASTSDIDDLKEKLRMALKENEVSRSKSDTEDKYMRLLEDARESHVKEIEQMKANLASTDLEIAESRGEIDQLHDELDEIQAYREELLEEIATVKLDLNEEKRTSHSLKAELSDAKLTVEKLKHEMKEKDIRLDQKFDEINRLKKTKSGGSQEVQRLQAEMKNMDETIARQKEQIDVMHGVIDELESHKQTLLSEATDMKMQLKEMDATIAQQKEQIEETHGVIGDLKDHKQTLLSEVTNMKLQMQEQASKSLSINTAPSTDDDETTISPAEKDQLVKDMQGLEARLARFHSKLGDKECKIDELTVSLGRERQANKQLRAEIKQLKSGSSSSALRLEQRPSTEVGDTGTRSELALLRKQNKVLSDEVDALRTTRTDSAQTSRSVQSASPYGNSASTAFSSVSQKKTRPSPLVLPPTLNRTTSLEDSLESPRTPVSGLVASFERRIGFKSVTQPSPLSEEDEAPPTPSVDMADLQDQLQSEKQLVLDLQKKLRSEKKTITELQEKLRAEKKNVTELQEAMSRSNGPSPTSLASELQESQQEVERLQAKLRETEKSQAKRDAVVAKERAELKKLRSEAVYVGMERDDFEKKIKEDVQEIERLRSELARSIERSSFNEEKKEEADGEAVATLEAELEKKEKAMEGLRKTYETYEEETEEQLERLKSQIEALQSELEKSLTKIEELQTEHKDYQKAQNHEIETMELELTMAKARHDDLVSENADKIKLLEDKITELEKANLDLAMENTENIKLVEAKIAELEKANLDLAMEVPGDAQKEFDDEAKKLTTELMKCQVKMADLEMEYSMKIKDLENRSRLLEVELEEERKEKESLQKFVDTSEAAATDSPNMEKKLSAEINRLSLELTKAQMGKANLERENLEKLKCLEDEVEALECEANEELDKKCDEIDALKSALVSKEEEIHRLEQEKTQLCTSMNDVSFSRKDEMDELQAELLDMTMQTKTQAREIQMLKMKIEEYEARKEDSSTKLTRRIQELEAVIHELNETARSNASREDVTQLKEENAQLRETIRDVKIERRQLKERFDYLTQDKSASRSSQVLRDRNNALKDEVEKLTKRLKKLESSITRFAI